MKQLVISILLVFIISGCIPYLYEITPNINGRIFDEKDSSIIKYANVSVTNTVKNISSNNLKTQSDDLGYFSIPRTTQWGIWIVPQEPYAPIGYTLEVEANGYKKYQVPLATGIWSYRNDQWENLKIQLKRNP